MVEGAADGAAVDGATDGKAVDGAADGTMVDGVADGSMVGGAVEAADDGVTLCNMNKVTIIKNMIGDILKL